MTVSPPILTAVERADPLNGWPEILLTLTNTQNFNLVGAADASFEFGIGSAVNDLDTGSDALLSTSTTFALDGTHSLGLQQAGTANLWAILGPYPATAGDIYSFTASFHAIDTTRTCRFVVSWLDDTGEVVDGFTSPSVADSASAWTTITMLSQTAPAGTVSALIFLVINDSPAGPLGPPLIPTVTPTGATGAVAYYYQLTDYNVYGESTGSPIGITTTGVSPLTGSHFNALSWTAVTGATGYDIYRSMASTCEDIALDFPTCLAVEEFFATCADLITYIPTPQYYDTVLTNSYHDVGAGPGAARLAPMVDRTGEQHLVDELGMFVGDSATWTAASLGVFEVIRSPGSYVLGASPLFPLAMNQDGEATIIDTNAPYGMTASYSATLNTDAGDSTSSNAASAVMKQAPDTMLLYHRLGWAKFKDES